jgi:hypothetical protein
MANLLKKLAEVAYTPGRPYQPATKPYCYWDGGVGGEWVLKFDGEWIRFGDRVEFIGTQSWVWVEGAGAKQVCIPGQSAKPAIPAQIRQSAIMGWNGGGQSVVALEGSGYFTFKVPAGVMGAVAGLSSWNETTLPTEQTHAFYIRDGQVSIMERGAVVAELPGGAQPGVPFQIIRTDGEVLYRHGGWSMKSSQQSLGAVHLDASLYMTGDSVLDPAMGEIGNLAGRSTCGVVSAYGREHGGFGYLRSREPLGVRGRAYMNTDGAHIDLRARSAVGLRSVGNIVQDANLVAVQGVGVSGRCRFVYTGAPDDSLPVGYGDGSAYGELPSITGMASGYDGNYGQAYGALPALTGYATGNMPEPNFAYGFGVLPPLSGSGVLLVGEHGEASGELPALSGMGSNYEENYSQAFGSLPVLTGRGNLMPPELDKPVVSEGLVLADVFIPVVQIRDVIKEGLAISFGVSATVFVQDVIVEFLGLGDQITGTQVIREIIRAALSIGGDMQAAQRAAVQYAVNAITGALTTYEGFDFDGFVTAEHQRSYGFKPDGLYRICSASESDSQISWSIDFGQSDFGSARGKILSSVYLGLSTDGCVYAKLAADDGDELTYRVLEHPGSMRAKTAKGVSGRRWNLVLEGVDATFADLDTVEFIAGESQRRLLR